MGADSAPMLFTRHPTRERIYATLLAEPGRAWTVREMAALLPDVSVEGVRTTLYLLVGNRLVEPVTGQRSLTMQLTTEGHRTLAKILKNWRS